MNDGQTILAVFLAIPVLAIAFVWILRREDTARVKAGRGILALGYSTKLGWVMGISMALLVWFLFSHI
jgi:hypothetical protein